MLLVFGGLIPDLDGLTCVFGAWMTHWPCLVLVLAEPQTWDWEWMQGHGPREGRSQRWIYETMPFGSDDMDG